MFVTPTGHGAEQDQTILQQVDSIEVMASPKRRIWQNACIIYMDFYTWQNKALKIFVPQKIYLAVYNDTIEK